MWRKEFYFSRRRSDNDEYAMWWFFKYNTRYVDTI